MQPNQENTHEGTIVYIPFRELEAKLKESLSDDAIARAKKEAEENAKRQLEVKIFCAEPNVMKKVGRKW